MTFFCLSYFLLSHIITHWTHEVDNPDTRLDTTHHTIHTKQSKQSIQMQRP